MGAPRALALCHSFRGALDFQTGRWQDAETDLRRAIELYRQVGSASGESLSLQRLGVLLTARGDTSAALELLNDGLAVAERAAMRSHALTRLYASLVRNRLAAGDLDGVRASLADGLETARRHGHCVTCNALLLPEAVRAQLALGDVAAADVHATELESTAGEFDSRVWRAMAAQTHARVLFARGRHDEAAAAFAAASAGYEACGQPYDVARCQLGHARALRAGGHAAAAPDAGSLEQRARASFAALATPGED
jgi:tetratricopeptide (TPR) repeat protein